MNPGHQLARCYGFRLPVAHNAGDDQIGIVERCAEGMAERIARLAPFVNRAWSRRGDTTGDSTGKRELGEQLIETGVVRSDIR